MSTTQVGYRRVALGGLLGHLGVGQPAAAGHRRRLADTRPTPLAGFGPDVAFLDRALAHVFGHYAVDPTHWGIGGSSDGASCARSLGLANRDLFTHVVAFSPGVAARARPPDSPPSKSPTASGTGSFLSTRPREARA